MKANTLKEYLNIFAFKPSIIKKNERILLNIKTKSSYWKF